MLNKKCKMLSIYDVLKLCRNLKHLRRLAQHKKKRERIIFIFYNVFNGIIQKDYFRYYCMLYR